MAVLLRNRLFWFFLIAFVVAWGTWIPAFFMKGFPPLLAMIGLFGPAIAAVIVATVTNGSRGLAEIFGRFAIWRFAVRWYALALALMPVAYAAVAFSDVQFLGFPSASMWTSGPAYYVIGSFVWLLAITSGEEIGWRGFALPIMLSGGGSRTYTASLFLGIVWAVWHAPVFLAGNGSLPYPIFFLLAIGLSLMYTALFVRSSGSLWPAILLHAGTDIGPRIIHILAFTNADWLIVITFVTAAGLAMLRALPAKLLLLTAAS